MGRNVGCLIDTIQTPNRQEIGPYTDDTMGIMCIDDPDLRYSPPAAAAAAPPELLKPLTGGFKIGRC